MPHERNRITTSLRPLHLARGYARMIQGAHCQNIFRFESRPFMLSEASAIRNRLTREGECHTPQDLTPVLALIQLWAIIKATHPPWASYCMERHLHRRKA
ncbi:hypothetical protein SCLCIDRAFT_244094 [Scleroderma citrinum Foug A]|uniref:Uncharacterized protein n=1 Tax=Scleroderma citrinum Foug A TaxID=1036808 RepID=A0A0C2Z369_9AGAM|nr:hypothetical protein SCLCIDRAFT_244094 [Scleroderma citrinum Foug A]